MKHRNKLLVVKEDAARQFVFVCCVLFFSIQFFLPFLSNSPEKKSSSHLFQSPTGFLSLSNKINHQEVNTLPHLTPFFFKPVPLNSCDKNLLVTISGIGPALAESILTTRKKIGSFKSMQDLLLVPGIGKSRMDKFSQSFSFKIYPTIN